MQTCKVISVALSTVTTAICLACDQDVLENFDDIVDRFA